ncbi:AcrR family transcriptional regulator [Pontibacter aydingkolensis]|uniref:TetR/AcrR family transcriptional regulator n=1 Tax=Pontibacter aydingkolensis TaxID=1911536 RepID=A0ABS7CXE4_9BACT|nr:TetR/AcrR family transcriptional regulator [Pontibacter aydingkolensis]MBW7468543.1 TetR/AcrR family transcriptional regulator [Pontibacter aydingkolensis]
MVSTIIKRELSRQLLLETGLKLFSEKGYEATSIRAIAKEACISLGLMYNYFTSKEDLLREIFLSGQYDIEASFATEQTSDSGITGIEQHILNTVALLKEKREFWRLLHSLRMQSTIYQEMKSPIDKQIAYIQKMIERNLLEIGFKNPSQEALLLFASLDGIASHFLMDKTYPIDKMANYLIQKYKNSSNYE